MVKDCILSPDIWNKARILGLTTSIQQCMKDLASTIRQEIWKAIHIGKEDVKLPFVAEDTVIYRKWNGICKKPIVLTIEFNKDAG